MSKDYYQILGVNRNANEAEIKKAFRVAARKYHPDQAKGDKKEAEKKFKEISEAYEILGDKQKRTRYNQFGADGVNFGAGDKASGFGTGGFDFGSASFSGFGDIFETFFNTSSQTQQRKPTRGADMEVRIRIKFEDAIFGITTELALTRLQKCQHCHGNGAEPGSKITTCKTCHGSGEIQTMRQTVFGNVRHATVCTDCSGEGKVFEKKCSMCHGTGRIRKSEKVKIKIPAGVNNNAVIRLREQGEAGTKSGPNGDLFVHIAVDPSREFERRETDIYSIQKIHFTEAVLGTEVQIKTVHGNVQLKIPAGTQSHTSFKLKNYGVPKLNSANRGDHFVKIIVEIPKKLSRKEQELFGSLAKESNIKIRKKGRLFS